MKDKVPGHGIKGLQARRAQRRVGPMGRRFGWSWRVIEGFYGFGWDKVRF